MNPLRVIVWGENVHEQKDAAVQAIYPHGMHHAIASGLRELLPIARGIDRYFDLPHEEMYGEPFDVPAPEEQVFISWFEGGEVFRSGCCWRRGQGRVFYFRP